MRDANELFKHARDLILAQSSARQASSPVQGKQTVEACHATLRLDATAANLVTARPVDARWARANVLHFLAETEQGAVLKAYNTRAADYLTDNLLVGAYGPIAMPSYRAAISELQADSFSRRAVFSFTDFARPTNRNIPACISFGHLLYSERLLALHVYQRSLNAWSVLPYDLVLLTSLLHIAAGRLDVQPGALYWTIGSLHVTEQDLAKYVDCQWASPSASLLVEDCTKDRAWALLHQEV